MINLASLYESSAKYIHKLAQNLTAPLPLVGKCRLLRNPLLYTHVLITTIPHNLVPIYLFNNCYLFKFNKLFGKCKWCINIHVKSKINNGSALVGRKDCKRKNISRQPIWYFYLNIAQRCHRHFKISLL